MTTLEIFSPFVKLRICFVAHMVHSPLLLDTETGFSSVFHELQISPGLSVPVDCFPDHPSVFTRISVYDNQYLSHLLVTL